jgi:hypothetical protein
MAMVVVFVSDDRVAVGHAVRRQALSPLPRFAPGVAG